jgi:hypothetical protein
LHALGGIRRHVHVCWEVALFKWFRRRRLDEVDRRRLLVSLARAEEELVETHVRNALDVLDTIGHVLRPRQALEIYLEAFDPGEPRTSIVVKRVLARLDRGDSDERPPRRTRRSAP